MTLDELKALLEGEGKTEIFETIVEMVNSEKEKGIAEKSKANREAQNLRKFKTALEALGYDGSADLDQFTSEIVTKVSKPKEDKDNILTMKALNQRIQELTDQVNQERNQLKTSKIQNKLTESLSNKVYGHQFLIKSLIADGKVDLNGDKIVFKDGDNVLDFDSGISKLLNDNKDIVKTVQNVGTGEKVVGNNPKSLDAIIQSNDASLIKENFADIAKELGLKL